MRKAVQVAILATTAVFALRAYARPAAPRIVPSRTEAPPWTADARGRLVYERYGCRMCHGDEGKGGFANPNSETDSKVPGVIYVAEGYTEKELRDKILDGVATIGKGNPDGPAPPYRMPGWRGQMTDQEADDLVRYLFSLYPKSAEEKWR